MIEIASIEDLSEILELQKIAFKPEAIVNGDLEIPPLTQSLDEIKSDYNNGIVFYKYTMDEKIVGSVRTRIDENHNCHIGRLVVHPLYQKKGIGKELMYKAENDNSECEEFLLFTGEKSIYVINFYKSLDYEVSFREDVGSHYLVHMKKSKKVGF